MINLFSSYVAELDPSMHLKLVSRVTKSHVFPLETHICDAGKTFVRFFSTCLSWRRKNPRCEDGVILQHKRLTWRKEAQGRVCVQFKIRWQYRICKLQTSSLVASCSPVSIQYLHCSTYVAWMWRNSAHVGDKENVCWGWALNIRNQRSTFKCGC